MRHSLCPEEAYSLEGNIGSKNTIGMEDIEQRWEALYLNL